MMNIKRTAEDAQPARTPRSSILAENVFWVDEGVRWSHLQANAKQPSIGKLIDEAMAASEVANPGPERHPAQGQ
jgi:type I restriction enzyme M protein